MQGLARRFCSLFVAATLIVGCGGGGGGGGSSAGIEFNRSGVAAEISAGNAELIAASVIASMEASGEVAEMPAEGIFSFDSSAEQSSQLAFVLTTYLRLNSDTVGILNVQPQVRIGPDTQSCPQGGEVTVSADLVNPDIFANELRLLPGDRFFATFRNCGIDDGLVGDGGFDFTVRSFSGDILSASFDMVIDLQFDRFMADDGGDRVLVDGGMTLDTELQSLPALTRLRGDVTRFVTRGVTWEYSDYSITESVGASSFTITGSGSLETDVYTGKVSFSVQTALSGMIGSPPESGEIVITGSNGTISIVPLSGGTNVELQVELDGAPLQNLATTWGQLETTLEDAVN